MGLTSEDVRSLLAAFESSPWLEMTVQKDADRVHLSRRRAGVPPVPTSPDDGGGHRVIDGIPSSPSSAATAVRSPSIGRFHRAASPGAPAAVEVGRPVRAADPVGFVEVMDRLMPVVAGTDGTVSAILVDDGATVEYGERLAFVAPDGGERDVGHG